MMRIDDKDREILALLQADADLSTQQIADQVGLSLSPCWRRIKRLREEGVLVGAVNLVDPKAVGLTVGVFASVTLTRHSEENVSAFEAFVGSSPEVLECHAVTGDRDYLLRIVVPDIEAYERFVSNRLLRLPFISAVSSRFSIRRVKYSTALPL